MPRSLTLLAAVCLTFCAQAEAAPLPDAEFKALQKTAKLAAKAKDWGAASDAVRALGRANTARAVEVIAKLIGKHAATPLYDAGRDALAAVSSPDAVVALSALVADKGPGLKRLLAVDACALRADAESADALIAALETANGPVLCAVLGALRRRKVEAARGALQATLSREEERAPSGLAAAAARDALASLGGSTSSPAAGQTRIRARFFGTTLVSDRIVFVIDVSTSMKARDPEPRSKRPTTGGAAADAPTSGSRVRIERARFQLKAAIDALDRKTRFAIVAYSGYLEDATANDEGYRFPADVPADGELPDVIGGVPWLSTFGATLVKANAKGKGKAKAFVDALEPSGSTFTLRALKHALTIPGVKAIVLLSDGAPTEIEGRRASALLSSTEILQRVAAVNRLRRVRIDTYGIGVEDEEAFGSFLRSLAEQNGGGFTDVR